MATVSRPGLDRREMLVFVLRPQGNRVEVDKSWLPCEGRGEEKHERHGGVIHFNAQKGAQEVAGTKDVGSGR